MMTATSIWLALSGLLSAVAYAGLWIGDGADGPSVPHFLGVMAAAFILYGVAGRLAPRVELKPALWTILVGAVLFRLLMAGPVLFSDDTYRYHWDGKVLASGRNPYRYAPIDAPVADLRDEAWQRIGHNYARTIYPPLTELLCVVTYWLWPSPGRIRVLATLFDLATLVPLGLILHRLRLPPQRLVVYAWNPLAIEVFANGGHLDSVSVCLAMVALLCLVGWRPAWSGLLWGLSFLGQTWSIVLAPLYMQRGRTMGIIVFAAVVVGGLAPFAGTSAGMFGGSTRAYLRDSESNSGLFALLQAAADWSGLEGRGTAQLVAMALWLALAAYVVMSRTRRRRELLRQGALLLAAALMLSPVCSPWYVCRLLPLLCIHPSRPWLAFTGLVLLSYLNHHDPALDLAARLVQYGILSALLLWEQLSKSPHRLWRGLRAVEPEP